MQRCGVPGVSVAVVHDFQLHWAKGYGVADVVSGQQVNTDTLFQAASISKAVTAVAALKAVQEGLLQLDTDINLVLKHWQMPILTGGVTGPVTLRMLASHTSGLGDGYGFPGYPPGAPLPDILQILNGEPPSNVGPLFMEREPMTAQKYSGGGTSVIQLALMGVWNGTFAHFMQDKILDPLGMVNSTFSLPLTPEQDAMAARAHDFQGNAMEVKYHLYPEQAAAGLWTTATSLANFLIDIQCAIAGDTNRMLTPELAQQMANPVGVGDYAVGFAIHKKGQGWYMGHDGNNWGFECTLLGHKAKGYGCVIMTNGANGARVHQELLQRIERVYRWDSQDKAVVR